MLENGGTLKPVPGCYKNQQICNKVVDNYPYALEFVTECYKTQKMCDKVVDTHSPTIKLVPAFNKIQKEQFADVFFCI